MRRIVSRSSLEISVLPFSALETADLETPSSPAMDSIVTFLSMVPSSRLSAHKLGSPILRTYIGFNPREVEDVQKEVDYALAQLDQVKPRAEEYNIKIAIENHCDLKTEELLDLVQQANSPYVGVCVDLGNFMIHLENPTESVKLLAPYIYSTHFKDYASEMMNWGFKTFGVPLGKGSIDLKAIVDILINESKLDRIMLELPVEKEATEAATLKKEDDCVAESVAYARNILLKDYN